MKANMKKILSLLLILLLLTASLASCKLFNKNSGNGDEVQNTGDNCFFADGVELKVILSKECEAIMSNLFSDVYEKIGVIPVLKAESSQNEKHEIIFGSNGRAVRKGKIIRNAHGKRFRAVRVCRFVVVYDNLRTRPNE